FDNLTKCRFFFSSRRRHTRFSRDWSSDVCSSDLLEQQGVGVGLHYPIPCHLQPAFESGISPRLPVAEHAAQHILSLPMFPHMTREQTEYVGAAIARAVETSQGTLTA